MLPQKKRLTREAFNRFFSVGKRTNSPLFTIVYAPHTTFHASVVVSKKVAVKAVSRNKIRRRIYDSVRQYHKERGTTGVFIFLTKKGIDSVPYTRIRAEVYAQLRTIMK